MVLGFHGCDESTGESLLRGRVRHLAASRNSYDWLGSGVYFWENDPQRAFEFAQEATVQPNLSTGRIRKPFVIGAIIDLGLCLNLLDRAALDEVAKAHLVLNKAYELSGADMPRNAGQDRLARFLDRAVLESLHESRTRMNHTRRQWGKYPPYDSVRGAFWEGGELYKTSGFGKKNHIQLAVRNPDSIKGYFRPIQS